MLEHFYARVESSIKMLEQNRARLESSQKMLRQILIKLFFTFLKVFLSQDIIEDVLNHLRDVLNISYSKWLN